MGAEKGEAKEAPENFARFSFCFTIWIEKLSQISEKSTRAAFIRHQIDSIDLIKSSLFASKRLDIKICIITVSLQIGEDFHRSARGANRATFACIMRERW